ncbi:MAG: response regulator [Gammaproteobacteria bacterium]|nr:response regulator [Gammaproteobacteria bacterium]
MNEKSEAKKLKYKRLRDKYIFNLGERLSVIREKVKIVCSPDASQETLCELHILVHNLNGSAGTFEVKSISSVSKKLEMKLAAYIKDDVLPEKEDREIIASVLEQLEELIESTQTSDAVTLTYPDIDYRIAESSLIYLVEDDEEQAEHLRELLQDEDYQVKVFTTPDEFRKAYDKSKTKPGAILMDLVFPEGDDAGVELMTDLGLGRQHGIPVIVISVRNDLQGRLAAFRAGACRYIQKPYQRNQLFSTLEGVTGRQPEKPFRVMLVDDDPELLEAEAEMLRDVGMDVCAISDPLKTLEEIERYEPELLVLDVYMPGATGPELAAVLRERDAHLQIPILFLSSETDMTQQLLALNLGGDDFLVKPIQPEHFILAVTARASRARQNKAIQARLEVTLYEREREHLAINHHAGVSVTNRKGVITQVNDRFCEMIGYSPDELLGQESSVFRTDKHSDAFYEEIRQTIKRGQSWHGEVCNQNKNGGLYWVNMSIVPFLDDDGQPYQYVSVQTDITDNKLQQQQLTDARNEAEQANQFKTEFISTMSHELRTPLNVIVGYGELLELSDLNVNDKKGVNYIIKAGQHLTDMINEMLDIARIESGQYVYSIKPVLISKVLKDSWGFVNLLAAKRNITLTDELSDSCNTYVMADIQRLMQIFINLLSNAIKYNIVNGSISMSCKSTAKGVIRISVKDTGIGIKQSDMVKVFEPFKRVSHDQEKVEGSGIGLAVTKMLVEAMEGKIGLDTDVGVGSTFWIEFPIYKNETGDNKSKEMTSE